MMDLQNKVVDLVEKAIEAVVLSPADPVASARRFLEFKYTNGMDRT